jgi:hypothetical protein
MLDPALSGSAPPRQHYPPHPHAQAPQAPPPAHPAPPYTAPPPDNSRPTAPYPQPTHQPYYYPSPTGASNQASPPQGVGRHGPDDNHVSPSGAHDGGDPDDPKRPRACEACRGLKVRCDQDPAHPEIPCKRCAKAGRQCIITQPSRKRQKKADSRVAELEKKLDALTAALHQSQSGQHAPVQQPRAGGAPAPDMMQGRNSSMASAVQHATPSCPPGGTPQSYDQGMPPRKRRRTDDDGQQTPSYDTPDGSNHNRLSQLASRASSTTRTDDPLPKELKELHEPWGPTNDDLKRYLHLTSAEEFVSRINSLINPELASKMFQRYVTKLSVHLPAVVFPEGTTAEHVFKEKPILYVCILSAASFGILSPDVSKQVASEAVGAIADCVVRHGAKSLELIQAMQVIALYYKPPEHAERTNFYQLIHMAAVMALDIGLGKRFNPSKARRGFGGPNARFAPGPGPEQRLPQDSDTLEARRAWLTCYYLCASSSMVLRRPNLVRWTNYMKECIEVLESHPDAFPSDTLFCQHVKIQHICEDIGLQFLMDDSTATISITDPKVTYALNVLESQLKAWKENVPPECRGKGLEFFEHVADLYLHEIALHFNHNVEDFRLPFTEESLKSVNNTTDTLTQNQMAALESCLRAAHGILDTMLSWDVETIKSLPMLLFFVRAIYALVILIKMHVAVCTPNSELGKMMRPEDLKVEYYIDSLIALFGYQTKQQQPSPPQPSPGTKQLSALDKPHPKVLRILGVLKEWFGRHKMENSRNSRSASALSRKATAPPTESEQVKSEGEQYEQTPLHMLSRVATGNQQQDQKQSQQPLQQRKPSDVPPQSEWTFNTPVAVDYSKRPPAMHPDSRFPKWTDQQQQQQIPVSAQQQPQDISTSSGFTPMPPEQFTPGMGPAGMNMVDPTNQDYGWGSGFEQAMDIALGGMDGLAGGGLDNWFLGDSMAPFGFQPNDGSQAGMGPAGPGW